MENSEAQDKQFYSLDILEENGYVIQEIDWEEFKEQKNTSTSILLIGKDRTVTKIDTD